MRLEYTRASAAYEVPRDGERRELRGLRCNAMLEIADIARALIQGGRLRYLLPEWLDGFHRADASERGAVIARAPEPTGDPVDDAYLAAVVEHLATLAGIEVPLWTESPSRFLARPYYPSGVGELLKSVLREESPLAFRRRNLFVSANAIERPSTPASWRTRNTLIRKRGDE